MPIEDTGGDDIFKEMLELDNKKVEVGFLEGNDKAQVAHWNQMGTRNMPSRPFMSIAFEKNVSKLEKETLKRVKQIASGSGDSSALLEKLGEMHQEHIEKQIRSNTPPANKKSTIRQKGHSKTLIGKVGGDGGHMAESVEYKVK